VTDDAALQRFLGGRPPRRPGEACELCAAPVADDHRHVVDLDARAILCTCRACALLFDGDTDQASLRTVPDRYLRIATFTLTPQQRAALQIPVGMAFVVRNRRLDRTVAFYPSPGGATESELPLAAWTDVVAANPALEAVADDVEAVLLHDGADGDATAHVVPIDRCYELVGLLRLHWHGFDGGQEVRDAITRFFAEVDARARTVAGGRP